MVQVWKSLPQAQVIITHLETDYILDSISIIVRRHENGFDIGTVTLTDTEAKNYVDKVVADDTIEIKQKDKSDASWTTILKGVIRRVEPTRSLQGNFLTLQCDGTGYGLAMAKCGEEYGTESKHASLDTIKEIVGDNTKGIVDAWVNKVLGTAVDSGYSYTTQIETIVGSIRYVYFPYKPCDKIITDLCDIVQAIKGVNAGPHWIVDTSGRVLIATVGNHGVPASTYWPSWWRTDEARSILEEGKDFVNFQFQQLAKEANYILYYGRFKRPSNGDYWTEIKKLLWGGSAVLSDDNAAGNYKIGSYSLKAVTAAETTTDFYIPSGINLAWDINKIGGKYNVPTVNFWCMHNGESITPHPIITMSGAGWSGHWKYALLIRMPTAGKWYYFSLPIGPYAKAGIIEGFAGWYPDAVLGGDWTDIDCIRFENASPPGGNQADMWVDGLCINGWVLRGARQNAAFSSSDPMKLKVITDEVAKDDSLTANDDSGLMGRLAHAEYLRLSSTPIVGSFTIPIANDLLPGQKIHIHAKKQHDGSFRIDADFRVTRLIHNISEQGFLTFVDVTDDLKNANPRPMPTQLNTLLGAVRPEFQDRQASSIKAREIDITQPILEKSY